MRMLEQALRPVEPPAASWTSSRAGWPTSRQAALEALEELADWELDAMRDPRNWVRPVAAVAVGTAAGAALVVLGCAASRRRRAAPRVALRGLGGAERQPSRAARSPPRGP